MTAREHAADPKSELRAQVRDRRRARTPDERAEAARGLAVRLGAVPEVASLVAAPDSGCVAAYAAYGSEPGTAPMRELLAVSGVGVLLPMVMDDGQLDWAWDAGELAVTPLSRGIPEPAGDPVGHGADGLRSHRCRVLLVPALAVARDGHRLGKGGGYYDRLLAALAAHPEERPLAVAVVHDDELLDEVPHGPLDAPVDGVLTPSAYQRLR